MKRYLALLPLILFTALDVASQTQSRGVRPVNETQSFSDNVKMVVIGISAYRNVPSLGYAHKDAQTFYNFMISKDGAGINPANTKLMLNEKATAINIFAALDWLVDETKVGETVIFYFAGHGDLENKTLSQRGFLLANDAPVAAYMAGGTVGILFLQDYLNTLVHKNKAHVILITDACHSGKLAGGIEGVANTATALQGEWENTIKILSSQPSELSQEGIQWNGGGGIFTYYLVKGLMGFADRNHDYKITLNEINIYLSENIPKETNFLQNPSVSGSASTVLVRVDSTHFAQVKSSESFIASDVQAIANRGTDDDLKKMLDTAVLRQYRNFRYCLEHNYFLNMHPDYGSAWGIFQELKNDNRASRIISSMKIALLSALQLKYQVSFNNVINDSRPPDSLPRQLVAEDLKHALLLIDSAHILYRHILASYYISLIPVENNPDEVWIEMTDKATEAEPENPLPYYFKGHYYYRKKEYQKAISAYTNASVLAPTWNWPINCIALSYRAQGKFSESVSWSEKVLKNNPKYYTAYADIVTAYLGLNQFNKADSIFCMLDSLFSKGLDANGLYNLGRAFIYKPKIRNPEKARYFFEKAIAINPEFKRSYIELANGYKAENNPGKSDFYLDQGIDFLFEKIREKDDDPGLFYDLACYYSTKGDDANALRNVELALQKGWHNMKQLREDPDLGNLRYTAEFDALLKKYSR